MPFLAADEIRTLRGSGDERACRLVILVLDKVSRSEDEHYALTQAVNTLRAYSEETGVDFSLGGLTKFPSPQERNTGNALIWQSNVLNHLNYLVSRFQFRVDTDGEETTPEIPIDNNTRSDIHSNIESIRKIVAGSSYSDRKKDAIYLKLNRLRDEIDTSQTRAEAAMGLVLEFSDTAGKSAEKIAPARKYLDKIIEALANAKEKAEQKLLEAPQETLAIEGPEEPEEPES